LHHEVYIVGAGMTPFGRHPQRSIKDLTRAAVDEALADAGFSSRALQAVFFANCAQGHMEGQHMIRGQIALRSMGIQELPVINVENACASGATALHLAVQYLRADAADVVLAVGGEKMWSPDKAKMMAFLREWGKDWTHTEMKCVLSQTNFAGAVHKPGDFDNRLLADLDSNGWPQTGRRKALREMRRALAFHLAGDQHLSVVTKHGIDAYRDGPVSFVNPAIVNSYYGRWWWPKDERPGANPIEGSPLPWTGDYEDGLGNKITMYAYANPDPHRERRKKAREPDDNFGDGDY